MIAQYVPSTIVSVSMKVRSAITMAASCHDLVVLEERRRQERAGRREPLGALRPDAGGLESPGHLAVLANAAALEHEDVVHADHVAFHSRDLGNLRHLAAAVRQ